MKRILGMCTDYVEKFRLLSFFIQLDIQEKFLVFLKRNKKYYNNMPFKLPVHFK